MKLDWNLMRAILGHVEAETLPDFLDDAEALGQWKEGQLLSERLNQAQDPAVRVVYTHLRLLCDNGYIEGGYRKLRTQGKAHLLTWSEPFAVALWVLFARVSSHAGIHRQNESFRQRKVCASYL